FAILADDDPRLRWIVDPAAREIREGDGEVDFGLTGTAASLVSLLTAQTNPAALLRSGRIRHIAAPDGSSRDVVENVRWALRVLRPLDGGDTRRRVDRLKGALPR